MVLTTMPFRILWGIVRRFQIYCLETYDNITFYLLYTVSKILIANISLLKNLAPREFLNIEETQGNILIVNKLFCIGLA